MDLAAARARWPGIAHDEAGFERHVATLTPLNLDEVWLTWAAGQGDEAACRHLDRDFLEPLRPVVRRVQPDSAACDEVMQLVRERLLVRPANGPARISTFQGSAPLAVWLRAVATRLALNAKRDAARFEPRPADELLVELSGSASGLESTLMRAQHTPTLRAAFRAALLELTARERNALRLHVIDGLSLEAIGRLYGQNKSTLSRALKDVHERLSRAVRRQLEAELDVTATELDSLVAVMRSQLELASVLANASKPEETAL